MALFKLTFRREVVQTDEFVRYVEAENEAAAYAIGADEADEANGDCPDDAAHIGDQNCGDWAADEVEAVDSMPADGVKLETE